LIMLSEPEWKLLQDMVAMQPSPPTPIHPRATGLANRAGAAITDGRNQEECRRRHRLERPRLFQWISKGDGEQSALPDDLRFLLPPVKHRRSKKNKTAPNEKHFAVSTDFAAGATPNKFDVLARKFVMPDGERMSLGCTRTAGSRRGIISGDYDAM
jgi:hypothetical protein